MLSDHRSRITGRSTLPSDTTGGDCGGGEDVSSLLEGGRRVGVLWSECEGVSQLCDGTYWFR